MGRMHTLGKTELGTSPTWKLWNDPRKMGFYSRHRNKAGHRNGVLPYLAALTTDTRIAGKEHSSEKK